jgi:hypothetical protein|tara:strand:- start:160 stop:1659 length:1500 start_codon:yes stop_codon:yes gene_type:complete
MSSIPYNYGSYIDAKVSMTDTGHVSAGKQIQSPASAGSRGLAKTTQFTNDRTQMKMGNTTMSESMVEIRNILNRIDGVNVPVQEAEHISPEIKSQGMRDFLDVIIDKDEPNVYDQMDDSAKILYKYNSMTGNKLSREQIDMLTDLRQKDDVEFEKQLTKAGVDLEKLGQVAKQYKDDPYESEVQEAPKQKAMSVDKIYDMVQNLEHVIQQHPDFKDYDKSIIMASLGQLKDDIAAGDLKETSVKEDSGELSRLKELSGIQEDAELTDQQKKGLEAIAKKYKGREGYNGDFLPIGYIKAIMSTGVGTDGMDGDEVEAFAKKLGKRVSEIEDEWEDFETLDNITNAMKGDINDVLGNGWDVNQALAGAAQDYLYNFTESYEPFPEVDEFDIEEDEDFEEVLGPLGFPEDETELFDAEYQGRKVPLNKPMRGDVKKFKVYVKDPKTGNVKKVNFGHGGTSAKRPTMRIRKSNPKARKSFRARHNCANPGPKTKARYWSCRKW